MQKSISPGMAAAIIVVAALLVCGLMYKMTIGSRAGGNAPPPPMSFKPGGSTGTSMGALPGASGAGGPTGNLGNSAPSGPPGGAGGSMGGGMALPGGPPPPR